MDTLVIGIGGNALLNPNNKQRFDEQSNIVKYIAKSTAVLSKKYKVVITHGNGTQIGDELIKNINSNIEKLPLYMLNAETQASIGSNLALSINSMRSTKNFITIITHVLVNKNDIAFKKPTKPIGPFFNKAEFIKKFKNEKVDYIVKNNRYRKIVPSPQPLDILEIDAIKRMLNKYNVICGGGGGVPIYKEKSTYKGIDAVIDKDLTTQIIANKLNAKRMIILTNVDYVYKDINDKNTEIKQITIEELKKIIDTFEEGTIKPKLSACIKFIENGGKLAQIGNINNFNEIINKRSGTLIIK